MPPSTAYGSDYPGPQRTRELDMYVLEYATRPAFWVIGALMLAWWISMIMFAPRSRPNEVDVELPDGKDNLRQPHFAQWVAPHITSRPRKVSILLACLVLGFLVALEGYWTAVTGWRLTAKFFVMWPAWLDNPIWIQPIYAFSATMLLFCAIAWVSLIAVIFMFQVTFTLEVLFIELPEHSQSETPRNTYPNEDDGVTEPRDVEKA